MALRYGFFNSINGDRKYDAFDMSSIFDGIIEDGVFATIGKIFAVTPGEGLQVIVDTGKAWFNHTWTSNDAKMPLDIDAADITLDRYDAVVLEVNNTESIRANSIKIIKGTAASDPQKPDMVSTDLIHQYPLAYVRVVHGATEIQNMYIELTVGKEPCPFVRGPLETVPIDALFAQWESEFDNWFDNVKSNLEGDVAANLQRQIDENYENTLTKSDKALLGLSEGDIPSKAFTLLNDKIRFLGSGGGKMTLTVQTSSGTKVAGVIITGLKDDSGTDVATNEQGVATGIIAQGTSILKLEKYGDIADFQKSYEVVGGESYSDTWTVSFRNYLDITSTRDVRFSKNVETLNVTVVGAGGGGSSGNEWTAPNGGKRNYGGHGGGGGYCTVKTGVSFNSNQLYRATVGSGGKGGTYSSKFGGEGGSSSFLSITAKGGEGGYISTASQITPPAAVGNGNGGNGNTPAKNGTVSGYTSFSEETVYGGGGGASGQKGAGYGGDGSPNGDTNVGKPGRNTFGGGGGGGGDHPADGGNGGSGRIACRMHLRVAS